MKYKLNMANYVDRNTCIKNVQICFVEQHDGIVTHKLSVCLVCTENKEPKVPPL